MARPKGSITRLRTFDADSLRPVLKQIYERLKANGVPNHLLPDKDKMILDLQQSLPEWLDWKKIDEYAALCARVLHDMYPAMWRKASATQKRAYRNAPWPPFMRTIRGQVCHPIYNVIRPRNK